MIMVIIVIGIVIAIGIYYWYFNRKNPDTTSSTDGIGHDNPGKALGTNDFTSKWGPGGINRETNIGNDLSASFRSTVHIG